MEKQIARITEQEASTIANIDFSNVTDRQYFYARQGNFVKANMVYSMPSMAYCFTVSWGTDSTIRIQKMQENIAGKNAIDQIAGQSCIMRLLGGRMIED